MALVRVRGLSVSGAFARVDLVVEPGQVVAIDDPLDAGKSAFAACLMGTTAPDEGSVEVTGSPILVPDVSTLDESATVGSAADPTLLARLGLGERLGDPIEHLSRGNRQRVVLAIAMSSAADVLIADEPFAGMDPGGIDALIKTLAAWTEPGRAAVLASHSFGFVRPFADHVVRLSG